MKKTIVLLILSIFIFNSCKKDNGNPVNIDAAPSPPTLLSPADTATGIAVPTTFSWKAIANTDSFTLQVSLSSSLDNPKFNKSGLTVPSQEVTGLSNLTIYYWRVSATNKYGISDWSNIRSFTTTGPFPGIPTLASPPNGSLNIPLLPILIWSIISGSDSYTVQISNNSSFTSFIFNQSGLKNTHQQVSGLSILTQYYWRVNATNKYGTSGWSNTYTFITIDPHPVVPNLLAPANNAIVTILPTLRWASDPMGLDSSYTLQVSTDSSFTSFVYNQSGLTVTSKQVIGLNDSTIYFWRVRATNFYGTSDWSNTWSFNTSGPSPAVPLLSSPVDGSTINSSPLSLSWILSTGATSYTLQVSVDSLFTSFVYNQSGLTTLSKQLTGLTAATYYWRVSASNNNGPSEWSTVWRVKIVVPIAPALLSPVNGATGLSLSPVLSWSASGGATSFTLQVSLNSSFTSFVYNQSGLTSLTQQVTALTAHTLYYWRVSASNGYGASRWTDTWSFTTQ